MATPELGIALDTVCSIVVRAREFDAQEAVVEEDYGSNPIDEDFRSVLEAYPDDPTFQELQSAIDGLNEDEQSALVALVWVGRGDYDLGQWNEALAVARSRRTGPTSRYLFGIPVLADYLGGGARCVRAFLCRFGLLRIELGGLRLCERQKRGCALWTSPIASRRDLDLVLHRRDAPGPTRRRSGPSSSRAVGLRCRSRAREGIVADRRLARGLPSASCRCRLPGYRHRNEPVPDLIGLRCRGQAGAGKYSNASARCRAARLLPRDRDAQFRLVGGSVAAAAGSHGPARRGTGRRGGRSLLRRWTDHGAAGADRAAGSADSSSSQRAQSLGRGSPECDDGRTLTSCAVQGLLPSKGQDAA